MDGIRTPLHLWIVGGLATAWNAIGAYDYLMTRTRNMDYLSSIPGVDANDMLAWFEAFPGWAQFGWGLGVWAGLGGSLLLLARSRWAVHAFGVSLAGLAASTVWQYVLSSPPPEMSSGAMLAMNLAIWAVAIGLLVYALRMRARGVLR